ncbi:MAG TPA: hypothetical protein VGN83_06070 [Falsiroseomonas sp.]|jgi:hypothetical protein|nr:hypothetical protein [Falsiroseomonas sp.]
MLRNALAHGNIIYLDEAFRENPGRRMAGLAFLSRRPGSSKPGPAASSSPTTTSSCAS